MAVADPGLDSVSRRSGSYRFMNCHVTGISLILGYMDRCMMVMQKVATRIIYNVAVLEWRNLEQDSDQDIVRL